MEQVKQYDVAVVGAGLAGCTAAILYGRAGLRVALLEAHADMDAYKRTCTHYIQPSALPVLQRLGLDRQIEAAGGVRNSGRVWTPAGWVVDPELFRDPRPAYGYNIRRSVLDPMIRRMAADAPGVELILGHAVDQVVREGDRVAGVRARTPDGDELVVRAPLVVGADGRTSKVASAAGVPEKTGSHGRVGYFAGYRGVALAHPGVSQQWQYDGCVNYVFPNDDGVTVLAALRPKAELGEFRADPEGKLLQSFSGLDEGPDLSNAVRVGDVVGVVNYPSITRPATSPGLALIGDAGLVGDYLWGVGCGWALQTAAWLVDATAEPLRTGAGLDNGLRRFARQRRRHIEPHQKLIASFATGRPYNGLERLLFGAAPHDARVADRFQAFGARAISPAKLLSPPFLLRAAVARRRGRTSASIPAQRAGSESAATRTDA